ncbi:Transketolase [Allomyces arbusculus]|nr:Transketolase [Allomyces arbusculus]
MTDTTTFPAARGPGAPFTPADATAINTIRCLAADMVQTAGSGHPGAPMGLAPAAHTLFTRFLRANPSNPGWADRDRFVLSNGHACCLQYILLHLLGYDMSLDDLKQYRHLDSKTPGHPESHMTPGVELTTGPLGQGIANAVGLAMAEAHLAATFNRPDAPKIVDHYTYVILGDGCLQEGVSAEAMSLAGHWKLGKLIALYDDNKVQIDGTTDLAFTENVCQRVEAYGWHTLSVTNGDATDQSALVAALAEAHRVTDRPTLIKVTTTIGFGSSKAGTDKVHGSALGADDVKRVKQQLGMNPDAAFVVPDTVRDLYSSVHARGKEAEVNWHRAFDEYKRKYPDMAADFERRAAGKLPDGIREKLPTFSAKDAPAATRKWSGQVLGILGDLVPDLMGGSADLTSSNLTRWPTAVDFQATGNAHGAYEGRYVRFGVREHGMAAICNGMAAHGLIRPFAATFLNFITYAYPSVRLAALAHHRVLYVLSHDSIGLGEDGPTHQPIETLALLRATPNLWVLRPADGNEVVGAYWAALNAPSIPVALILSRQSVPVLAGSSAEGTGRGAYILQDAANPTVVLVATGTEVALAVEAVALLDGLAVRVVSMPSWELFDAQTRAYQESVLLPGVPVVAVEALGTIGWRRYAHAVVGMRAFGASGAPEAVYAKFGITKEAVAAKAREVVKYFNGKAVPNVLDRFE